MRAQQQDARGKTRAAGGEVHANVQTKCTFVASHTRFPSRCGGLELPGVSLVKRGEQKLSYVYELM